MDIDVPRLYWSSLALFGLVSVVDTALRYSSGAGFDELDWILGLAGLFVLVAALAGLRAEDSAGAPEEPGLILYVVLGGAALYTISTVATWI